MSNPLDAFTAEVAAFVAHRPLRVEQHSGFEWGAYAWSSFVLGLPKEPSA